jgi:hypothetical protein
VISCRACDEDDDAGDGGGDQGGGGGGLLPTPGGGGDSTTNPTPDAGSDGGTDPDPDAPPAAPSTPEPGGPKPVCVTCVPLGECSSGYGAVCVVEEINPDGSSSTWGNRFACHPAEPCETPPEPGNPGGPPEPPCIPEYNDNGIDINGCTKDTTNNLDWGYNLWVSARVPAHRVQVIPFPRWFVAMGAPLPEPFESGEPGRLVLQDYPAFTPPGLCSPNGPGFSDGCWSDAVKLPDPVRTDAAGEEAPWPGDVKEYRMGLRWRRLDQTAGQDLGAYPPICWTFDEREWNIGENYGYGRISNVACGTSVEHIYETSSWEKPHNGARWFEGDEVCPAYQDHCCEQVPSGDGEWDMPAYQVRVPTFWGAEWALEWEAWERVPGGDWTGCFWSDEYTGATPGVRACIPGTGESPDTCAPADGAGCIQDDVPVYDWVHHFDGWNAIDLRLWGSSPTWYYTSWAVVTTGAGPWCEFEYGDPNPGTTVRVPVIEFQVVLRPECVLDDSCDE